MSWTRAWNSGLNTSALTCPWSRVPRHMVEIRDGGKFRAIFGTNCYLGWHQSLQILFVLKCGTTWRFIIWPNHSFLCKIGLYLYCIFSSQIQKIRFFFRSFLKCLCLYSTFPQGTPSDVLQYPNFEEPWLGNTAVDFLTNRVIST